VAQFGSFTLDRRLWRIKGKREGTAVEILRQQEQKISGTASVSCVAAL